MNPKAVLGIIAAVVTSGLALCHVSNWWERSYATFKSSELSPDGCFRIDTYEPFWILPSIFHRSPNTDPAIRNSLGRSWQQAIFKRAYELRTGDILGETIVFDPVGPANRIYWGDTGAPGRRVVFANEFLLFDSDRCSDQATLAKLAAFYQKRREANRLVPEGPKDER
ncbi:MAG TPA: hypothetical protein VM621_02085 [Luteibacter sp.]|uniref:hypothetical protein n=1 Tax=Luteibacter sp. TaxID=1886636 RepID=UPI002CEADFB9|nr:hypothetical protein [Luteibacter sp.]HVI53825.1 hypothetical protein [Luteibacter sp.]